MKNYRKKVNKMKTNIIALSQKDLHKLGKNLNGVILAHNCSIYENMIHTKKCICEALGFNCDVVKYYSCYQVAYSCGEYGCTAQLHRVELELINGKHLTMFVYYTSIKYKDE